MTAPTIQPTDQLEELWDKDIPCGGIGFQTAPERRIPCPANNSAALVTTNHHSCWGTHFKCHDCYAAWRTRIWRTILTNGHIVCWKCGRLFNTPDQFRKYREI